MDDLTKYVSVDDFRKRAEQILNKRIIAYLYGAANDGITYKENTEAFKRYKFRPKLMRDVSVRNLRTSLLGQEVDIPIGISPFGLANRFYSKGELALVKATEKLQTCYIHSHWSSRSVEEVTSESPNSLKWIQVYIYENREMALQLVKRAERLGYKAVVLTIDVPVLGRRLEDAKNKFSFYDEKPFEKDIFDHDQTSTWKDIGWLKHHTDLPVVVKGIMTRFDARQAVDYGADAIFVSNHGGRQLDGVSATIDVLEEVAGEVNGAIEIYIDGGIRSGTDVLKALALGARAVFIARPAAWGLTCGGEEGVSNVLNLLKEELDITMALCGQTSVQNIDRDIVMHKNFTYSKI